MLKQDRQSAIVSLLNSSKTGSMTTVKIASELNVAAMTIRRDLKEMAEHNLLTRIYGGATLYEEKTTKEKRALQKEAKDEIGREIAHLVEPKTSIYLGAGTTVFASLDFFYPKMRTFNSSQTQTFHSIISLIKIWTSPLQVVFTTRLRTSLSEQLPKTPFQILCLMLLLLAPTVFGKEAQQPQILLKEMFNEQPLVVQNVNISYVTTLSLEKPTATTSFH